MKIKTIVVTETILSPGPKMLFLSPVFQSSVFREARQSGRM